MSHLQTCLFPFISPGPFSISPHNSVITRLCILWLTTVQVDKALSPAEASVPPAPPSAVLTADTFWALCNGPPIQAPSVRRHPRSFEPLSPQELGGRGLLLGIDAEFVQHWPAEKVMQG